MCVGPDQLPEINKVVEGFARRLGMKVVPEVYVVEDATQNGVAMKLGSNDIVMLTDDVIWGALHSGDPRQIANPVRYDSRLTGARPGEDQKGAALMQNSFPLHWI